MRSAPSPVGRASPSKRRVPEALELIEKSADSAWHAARKMLDDVGGARRRTNGVIDLSAFVEDMTELLGPKAAASTSRADSCRTRRAHPQPRRPDGSCGTSRRRTRLKRCRAAALWALRLDIRADVRGDRAMLADQGDGPGMSPSSACALSLTSPQADRHRARAFPGETSGFRARRRDRPAHAHRPGHALRWRSRRSPSLLIEPHAPGTKRSRAACTTPRRSTAACWSSTTTHEPAPDDRRGAGGAHAALKVGAPSARRKLRSPSYGPFALAIVDLGCRS